MLPAGQEALEEELIDVDMLEQECEAGESIEDNMYGCEDKHCQVLSHEKPAQRMR